MDQSIRFFLSRRSRPGFASVERLGSVADGVLRVGARAHDGDDGDEGVHIGRCLGVVAESEAAHPRERPQAWGESAARQILAPGQRVNIKILASERPRR